MAAAHPVPPRALNALLLLLVLLVAGAEAARLPAAGAPAKPRASKPSLDGVFLALDKERALFSAARWEQEFRAMQAVGINFLRRPGHRRAPRGRRGGLRPRDGEVGRLLPRGAGAGGLLRAGRRGP